MAARVKRGDGTIRYDPKAKAYVGRLSFRVDGKRERPSVTGRTYTECRVALRKLLNRIETGVQYPKRDQECIASYLTDWLAASNLASSTLIRYKALAKKVSRDSWFANLKLYEVTTAHILRLYHDMACESESTRRKIHVLLHTAFEDARHVRRIAQTHVTRRKSRSRSTVVLTFVPSMRIKKPLFLPRLKATNMKLCSYLRLIRALGKANFGRLSGKTLTLRLA